MSIVQIPLKAVPSQSVAVFLGGQQCVISLRQVGNRQWISVSVAGAPICQGVLVVNNSPIVAAGYSGFIGELCAFDTQGDAAPDYAGWGSRWVLLYNDAPTA